MSARRDLSADEQASVLSHLRDGKPLRQWCREHPEAPSRETIDAFRRRTPEFQAAYDQARLEGADEIAQDALDIIDAEPERITVSHGENTSKSYIDSASVQRAKNRAYFRMEALKKWFPQKYGDKVTNDINVVGYDAAVLAMLQGKTP